MQLLSRVRVPELMDDPNLDDDRHYDALRSLHKLNKVSKGASFLWKPLRLLSQTEKSSPLRILDLATGGGEIPIELQMLAKKNNLPMQIDGCDFSERAVAYAARQAADAGSNNQFFHLDALNDQLPQNYDVIMCSLFMHHLDPEQVISLLAKMSSAANKAILVNDLLRSSANLILVTLASRMFSSSDVVHHDGPVSVRAAYSINEMQDLAQKAGLKDFTIQERFPCRYLLDWRK